MRLATGHREKREYAQALPLYEQARASFEAAGDRAGVGFACDFIASCDENMGQPARALPPEPRGGGASSGPAVRFALAAGAANSSAGAILSTPCAIAAGSPVLLRVVEAVVVPTVRLRA